jgi:hypothetical protein
MPTGAGSGSSHTPEPVTWLPPSLRLVSMCERRLGNVHEPLIARPIPRMFRPHVGWQVAFMARRAGTFATSTEGDGQRPRTYEEHLTPSVWHRFRRSGRAWGLLLAITLTACSSVTPSARLRQRVDLPLPVFSSVGPDPGRLSRMPSGESRTLTARSLIPLAFNSQPDIKASFQRFKS